MFNKINQKKELEEMPLSVDKPYISSHPWYVEEWYDDDIIKAMHDSGIYFNEINFKIAKEAVKDIFKNLETRNEILRKSVESAFRNQYVKTDDLQYQKALSQTEFSMKGAAELPGGVFIIYNATFDVSDYEDDKESIITCYYDSMSDFEEAYPDHILNAIFAECIFEQMLSEESVKTVVVNTEEEAERLLQKLISEDSMLF